MKRDNSQLYDVNCGASALIIVLDYIVSWFGFVCYKMGLFVCNPILNESKIHHVLKRNVWKIRYAVFENEMDKY